MHDIDRTLGHGWGLTYFTPTYMLMHLSLLIWVPIKVMRSLVSTAL